jgi:hypothetical protein
MLLVNAPLPHAKRPPPGGYVLTGKPSKYVLARRWKVSGHLPLACLRMGMSTSASFQYARKSWYATNSGTETQNVHRADPSSFCSGFQIHVSTVVSKLFSNRHARETRNPSWLVLPQSLFHAKIAKPWTLRARSRNPLTLAFSLRPSRLEGI